MLERKPACMSDAEYVEMLRRERGAFTQLPRRDPPPDTAVPLRANESIIVSQTSVYRMAYSSNILWTQQLK